MHHIKIILALVFIIPLISLASATYPMIILKIQNGTVYATGSIFYDTGVVNGIVPGSFMTPINDSFTCTSITNTTIVIDNSTNQTTSTCTLNYEKTIPLTFNSSGSVVVTDNSVQSLYNTCLQERAQFATSNDLCNRNYIAQGEFKDNYTTCSTNLQICNADKTNMQTQETTLQQNLDSNSNQRFVFLVVGLVLGVLGEMWRNHKFGVMKNKNIGDSFNSGGGA